MADALRLADRALELGRQELKLLESGQADEAGDIARERGQLLASAWKQRQENQLDALLDKLQQMQRLQGRLTEQARRVKEEIRQELRRIDGEHTRFAGYAKAARPASVHSRFISKKG